MLKLPDPLKYPNYCFKRVIQYFFLGDGEAE